MTINIDKHGPDAGPVLDIDHLKVTFATDAGDVYAVKDVASRSSPARSWRSSANPAPARPSPRKTILGLLPETAISSGAVAAQRQQRHQRQPGEAARDPGPRRRHGLPGAVHRAQPGLHRGLADRRGHPRAAATAEAHGSAPRKPRRAPSRCSRKVGIPDPETRVDYYPHQFSGGQKQRVVIAIGARARTRG